MSDLSLIYNLSTKADFTWTIKLSCLFVINAPHCLNPMFKIQIIFHVMCSVDFVFPVGTWFLTIFNTDGAFGKNRGTCLAMVTEIETLINERPRVVDYKYP